VGWFERDVDKVRKRLPSDGWEEFDFVSKFADKATRPFGGFDCVRAHVFLMCVVAVDIAKRLKYEIPPKDYSEIFRIQQENLGFLAAKFDSNLKTIFAVLVEEGHITHTMEDGHLTTPLKQRE
jgi:hypothetical protein